MKNNDLKNGFPKKEGYWKWVIVVLVFFVVGFLISRYSDNDNHLYKRTQILLGTVVEIQIREKDQKKADNAITKAFEEIKRIDELFSTYNDKSEVWRINHSSDTLLKIDDEIYNLLVLCDSVTKLSDGYFDVSLDSLTRLWGFNTNNPKLPTKIEIDSVLKISGWENIRLIVNQSIIKKKNVGFNFGAIAKGYAVDKAIEVLKNFGVKEALVNAGGDVKVFGKQWKVGVQHPREPRDIIKILKLENNSVATSGDYEQYFEAEGKRYHHILNPKTGYPTSGIQSVSIINKSNTFADALATAVFVLGLKDGMSLVESLDDTEAMIIDENGKINYSSKFINFLLSQNQ